MEQRPAFHQYRLSQGHHALPLKLIFFTFYRFLVQDGRERAAAKLSGSDQFLFGLFFHRPQGGQDIFGLIGQSHYPMRIYQKRDRPGVEGIFQLTRGPDYPFDHRNPDDPTLLIPDGGAGIIPQILGGHPQGEITTLQTQSRLFKIGSEAVVFPDKTV